MFLSCFWTQCGTRDGGATASKARPVNPAPIPLTQIMIHAPILQQKDTKPVRRRTVKRQQVRTGTTTHTASSLHPQQLLLLLCSPLRSPFGTVSPKNHIPITEATEVPASPAPVGIQLITPRSPNLLNPHSTTVLQRFGVGALEEQQTKKKGLRPCPTLLPPQEPAPSSRGASQPSSRRWHW